MANTRVRVAVSAAGLIAGGFVATAGAAPASAIPTNCYLTLNAHSASAVCHSGTGQVRVWATCEHPLHGTRNTYYGTWVGVGSTSVVNCPTATNYTWYRVAAGIQRR